MSESLYELAFSGRLVDGVSLNTAKSNATKLFKASAAQVDKMFAGGRVVIRNKLDKATADKYIAVMRKNGLVCEADIMGIAGVAQQPASAPPKAASKVPEVPQPTTPSKSTKPVIANSAEELKVLPLSSGFSVPGNGSEHHEAGINLAGDEVNDILQQSHLGLDPEGVRLSEHHDVDIPVFSELDGISLAPTGSDLVDPIEEVPPIVPDVSSISIAPTGSDLGQLKKNEAIEVPDLSHLRLDDLPDNQ